MAADPATFVLIPGAGGQAWYWHRVTPLLIAAGHDVVAVDLPAEDDTAGLHEYADHVAAAADRGAPLVVVAQSMGAFTAPLVADRLPTELLVLVNPMVPLPGESGGQWWEATGQRHAMSAHLRQIGLGRDTFDSFEDFFHDVPESIRQDALHSPEPGQSDTPFDAPWPLPSWPDVRTAVIAGRDDRLFPLEFQRRVARERLGLEVDVVPGGHLLALSYPGELVHQLLSYLPS
jgi:pimeloyl-ACP methyl ester carboxylesterase